MKLVALLRSTRRAQIAALSIYFALAALYTWPLLAEGGSRIASDPGDPVLNASILWWNATNLPFSSAWWNAPHYYPSESISAFTDDQLEPGSIARASSPRSTCPPPTMKPYGIWCGRVKMRSV